jgi:NAD+ synthase (glutamine-hydrolysing)
LSRLPVYPVAAHIPFSAVNGPYELQDFNLYYTLRFGYPPPKVAFLGYGGWHDREKGVWPNVPSERRHQYGTGEIKASLCIFLDRFFRISQFKRSCTPNAPKVGSGGFLSPRGDYRAPSDSEATVWLRRAIDRLITFSGSSGKRVGDFEAF